MSTYRHQLLNVLILGAVLTALSFLGLSDVAQADVSFVPQGTNYSLHCTSTNTPANFSKLVHRAARKYDIDARMLAVTVYRESGCDPTLTGTVGDAGLGQIVPKIWLRTLIKNGLVSNKQDLYDPAKNLNSTAWILSRLSAKYPHSKHLVFKHYNGSGKRARQYGLEQLAVYQRLWL